MPNDLRLVRIDAVVDVHTSLAIFVFDVGVSVAATPDVQAAPSFRRQVLARALADLLSFELVAFSCKGRAVCPSCAGRRMADAAAHLVDRVLPAVPLRQWVLSLPFELRALAAFRPDVLSALSRIFIESVFARYRARARRDNLKVAAPGAVTHVQRFGSSINLNVHLHTMVLDGVFTRDAKGRPVFHTAPPPTREELCQIVHRIYRRAVAWLRLKGHLATPDDADSQAAAALTALDACAAIAVQRGSVVALRDDHTGAAQESLPSMEPPPVDAGAAEHGGFNVHASVAIDGDDDLGPSA